MSKIIQDSTFVYNLEHNPERSRISYQDHYYEYIYSDTSDYQLITDSVLIFVDYIEDHYFNHDDYIDSSIYFTSHPDSLKIDTSRVILFSYSQTGELSQTREIAYWPDTAITQFEIKHSENRIDSIFEYSNVTPGTFGPTYHDTLQLIKKIRFNYDSVGRKTSKEKYWRSIGSLIETYDYPNAYTMVKTQAPYHPQRACIEDPSISLSKLTILIYYQNGLVGQSEVYHRTKKENEDWQKGLPFSYQLRYEYK